MFGILCVCVCAFSRLAATDCMQYCNVLCWAPLNVFFLKSSNIKFTLDVVANNLWKKNSIVRWSGEALKGVKGWSFCIILKIMKRQNDFSRHYKDYYTFSIHKQVYSPHVDTMYIIYIHTFHKYTINHSFNFLNEYFIWHKICKPKIEKYTIYDKCDIHRNTWMVGNVSFVLCSMPFHSSIFMGTLQIIWNKTSWRNWFSIFDEVIGVIFTGGFFFCIYVYQVISRTTNTYVNDELFVVFFLLMPSIFRWALYVWLHVSQFNMISKYLVYWTPPSGE